MDSFSSVLQPCSAPSPSQSSSIFPLPKFPSHSTRGRYFRGKNRSRGHFPRFPRFPKPHSVFIVLRGTTFICTLTFSSPRFPPRSKDFFFTSCGSPIPFTRANAQRVIHGFNQHLNLHCRVNSLFHHSHS